MSFIRNFGASDAQKTARDAQHPFQTYCLCQLPDMPFWASDAHGIKKIRGAGRIAREELEKMGDYGVIAYDEDAPEYIESIPALMRSSADLQDLRLSIANALVTFSVISRLNSNKY